MTFPSLLTEEAYYFYISSNVKDNFTDLIVSIIEDYAVEEDLIQSLWYQELFLNDSRAVKIKSFWSISSDLFILLKDAGHLVTKFHGLHLWACEQDSFEDALQFLRSHNTSNPTQRKFL